MKKWLILAIFLTVTASFTNAALSANKVKTGETAYVWAENGVWLRDGPAVNAAQISKLVYGTAIKIISEGNGSYSSVAVQGVDKKDTPATYPVSGAWREVQVALNNETQKGYVFDGWLSTMPPLKCKIDNSVGEGKEKTCEELTDWGKRNFGFIKKRFTHTKDSGCSTCGDTRYTFGKGVVVVEHEPGYGSSEELLLPGIGLSEGVVIALGIHGLWGAYGTEYIPIIESSNKEVSFTTTYQQLVITLTNKGLVIEDSCRDC